MKVKKISTLDLNNMGWLMRTNNYTFLASIYYLWLLLFVIAPIVLLIYQSFIGLDGEFTWQHYLDYFSSRNYLVMTLNSFFYAFLITAFTLLIAYPFAYWLAQIKYKEFWLLLVILPSWINILLKTYAFIGILAREGAIAQFLMHVGVAPHGVLFTDFAFILVAVYIELPFMILPIFRSLENIPKDYTIASADLGATEWQTFWRVIVPLSIDGVRSGIQAVFIPSLSLFMITRLVGGNRVITLGTAVEQHYLVTQNWGMGSTIGVVLIFLMMIVMFFTRRSDKGGNVS